MFSNWHNWTVFIFHAYLFVLLTLYPDKANGRKQRELKRGGKNVCTFYQSKTVYATVKQKVSTISTVEVCCSKWIACWKKCRRPRVSTKTITRTISRLIKEHVTHCCEGYTVDSSGSECSTPICNPQCRNGAICIGPNRCKCQKGFEGRFCQLDINECLVPEKTGCSQRCINLPGTFSCLCERGFVPGDPYSKTCKDINECKGLGSRSNPCRCYGEHCDNVCQNTIGSYRCRCGAGFKLSVWNICVDRNECIETPEVCPHQCINTPGSYKCQCWNGFRWNRELKQCEETNECSIGNGGCEHNCHNVYGGHVCSCRNGFYLADNRFSCVDFNECNGPTECDSRTSICVNTPGNYYCKCKNGFKFDQICIDRDECTEKTALCNQKCKNTFGSYSCSCNSGYYLSSDRVTCKDIDECSAKKCDQICLNTPGSYTCFCREGYMLDVDGKTCKPKLCEIIQAPFYGAIACNGNTVGKSCTFSCNDGYHLDINSPRKCLPSGKWSSRQPRCIPNACRVPRPPANGKLLLPCDQSYGSTCPVICNRGYVLRGPSLLKCEMRGSMVQWDIHKVRCEEILICKPNPCKFGGKCSIVSPTKYSCNCSGTGHEGQNCEIGFVSISRFPKIAINDKRAISLSAKPSTYVQITIFPEDASITTTPDSVMIRKGEKSGTFLVTGRHGGIKSVSYDIASGEPYTTPKQSMFLVYNEAEVMRSKVERLSGLVSGCYEMSLKLKSRKCKDVKIISTHPWSIRSFGKPRTNGLAVIQISNHKFPMVLPGVDTSEVFSDSSELTEYNIDAGRARCAKSVLTSGQLQYIAKMDVFTTEFVKQFNTLMPVWFQVQISERMKLFSEDNIRAFIWSAEKLQKYELCSELAIDRTGNFLAYIHHENIGLKVHDKTIQFKTQKAFCLAVDTCKMEPHLQLPEEHMSDIISLLSFQELSELGWKLSIKSIGFAKTAQGDTRKCLAKHTTAGLRRIVFGGSKIEYKNKKGIRAEATGDLVLGFKQENGKEIVDLSSSCIDGNSLVETPTWKTTDIKDNIYERGKAETNVVNLVKGPSDNRQSILSVIQKGGSVFKVKSGMRPIIKKSSRDLKVNFKYKQTKASAEAVDDDNFSKYNNLEMLSFVVMDLEGTLEFVMASGNIAVLVSQLKSSVNAWSLALQNDVNDCLLNIDNSKLISGKVKANFYKAKKFGNDLNRLLRQGGSSIGEDNIAAIKNSMNEMKVVVDELEKSVKSAGGAKAFHTLTLNFNSSMCLLKPCMSEFPITMYPQSTDVTKQGFCYDPSKTPFQMWDTEAAVFGNHQMGRFFKFSTGDRFFLCLSVYGVKKGKFTGTLNVLGNSLKSEFVFERPKISIPVTDYKIFGRYNFQVNGTVDATLNKWEMISVLLQGKADQGTDFVRDFQSNMDRISVAKLYKFRSKQNLFNKKLIDLEAENGFLRSKLFSNQQAMRTGNRRYEEAKRRLLNHKRIYEQQKKIFSNKRRDFQNLENDLNKICSLKKCPLQCIKMNECNVCQEKIYGKKTIPKCKTEFQTRSYAYKDSYRASCSHVVEDRRLKYTGSCKEPQLEANARKRILDQLKKKQKNNQSLTIEDALNLELVHKESGQKLLKAIQKQNFFKSFPKKLQSGFLSDDDLVKLKGYTNSSFAAKIRKHLKSVKLQTLIKEMTLKMQQRQELTEEDYERVKKLDPELARKLKSNEAVQDVLLKIKTGKTLTESDLNILKTENREFYDNYTRATNEREIFIKIERKLQRGNITSDDIEELAKVNPKAAEKLKDSLKEQLLKKVNEMKNKMANVKNSLDSGFGNGDISLLSNKLSKLTKNVRPFDKLGLQRLQEKIKLALASKGSIFEEVLERFDLALEVQNVTGSSSDLKRTVNKFFSSLERFNLGNIFKQSQNLISERLKDLQKWFDAASKFLETLCSRCGENCNKENAVHQVLSEIKMSIGKFEKGICQFEAKEQFSVREIQQICRLVRRVKNFSQTYITRKSKDCTEIKSKLVIEFNNIAKTWKNLRNSNADLFYQLWKRSLKTKSTLSSYVSLSRSINNVLKGVSASIKLPLPKQQELENRISKILRPGTFRLKDTEYLVSKVSITAFKDAVKLMPVNAKSQPSLNVAIRARAAASTSRKFKQLLSKLLNSLSNLCSKPANSEIRQEEERLRKILRVVEMEFDKMLSSKTLSTFFSASQRFAAVMEHSLTMAENIKTKKQQCIEKYQAPLASLSAFLQNVQSFDYRSYKDVAKGIQTTLKDIGNGIKAPIGKLMDYFEKIAVNTPSFDLPLMLTLSPDYFKLSISSLKDYFKMMSKSFKSLVEISDKCKQCRLEDVFGKYNLKAITKKLDEKFEYISKKASRFIENMKYNVKGSALFITSLEQIRTNLQRFYKSETGLNKETLNEIAENFKTAEEAAELIQNGQFDFILTFSGTKNKEVFTIVGELTGLKHRVYELFEKSKGSKKQLSELHSQIKSSLSKIPSITESIESLSKGSVEKRLEIIKNVAKIVKDLIKSIPKLYKSSASPFLKYIQSTWLPAVGKHLDKIEEAKSGLFSKTQTFLEDIGLMDTAEKLGISSIKTNARPKRRYSHFFKRLQASPASRKAFVLREMKQKASADEKLITKFTDSWRNLYERITGKVDKIKAKVTKLREKFNKYAVIFKDLQNTVDKIKKGPVSEIGKIKDLIEGFTKSFEDYDFRKIMTSDVGVVKRKLAEIKEIFRLSGEVFEKTDKILSKCKNFNIGNTIGYRFLKDFAGKFEKKLSLYYDHLHDFANKFSSGLSEVQNIASAVGKLRDRFKYVFDGKTIGSGMLKDLANALRGSTGDIHILQESAQDLGNILLGQDVDLQVMRASYDGLVGQLEHVLNKSSAVAKNVETVYKQVKDIGKGLDQLDSQIGSLKKGPLKTRIAIATDISKGIKAVMRSLPKILESSESTLESAGINAGWVGRFATGMSSVTGKLEKVLDKTDSVLAASGVLLDGKKNISKQMLVMRSDIREMKKAPWHKKIDVARNLASRAGQVMDTALDSVLQSANALNLDLQKQDLVSSLQSAVGQKRLEELRKISDNVIDAVVKLQNGPISEIGKLTDSVENFVDGLKDFDIGKAILSDPASFKEKVTELQQLADGTADILVSISDITGVCKDCNIDNVLGKEFMKKISKDIGETFKSLYVKVKNIGSRVKLGHSGWNNLVNTAGKISDGFNNVIRNKKVTPQTFRLAAKELRNSAVNLQGFKESSSDIFKAIFDENDDMKSLQKNFEGLVDTVSSVMNKTAEVSDKVETAYETINNVRGTFKSISDNFDSLQKGPLDTRVDAVRQMVAGARGILQTLPRLMNESGEVGSSLGMNSRWLGKLNNGLLGFTKDIDSVFHKTDLSLKDAGIAVQSLGQISEASRSLSNDFKAILNAPFKDKFKKVKGLISKVDGIFGTATKATTAIDSILKRSLNTDIKITSSLSKITDSASGLMQNISKGVQHVEGIFEDITKTVQDIKSGPVTKVGALTDSVRDYVKSMKNFNIAEILVLSPKFATEKFADIKDIIKDSGAILRDISSVVSKACPACNMNELFGSKFFVNIKNDLTTGFDKLVKNATNFLNKVGEGAEGVAGVINSVNGIGDQLKKLKGVEFNTDGINTLSGILDSSSNLVASIKGDSSKVFNALFDKNKDMLLLKGKFEGLVTNVGSFLKNAGKVTAKVEDAFAKVDEVKKSFDSISNNFKSVGEGPLEGRVKAAKNIVNGVMSITSGLPDLFNSASLGLKSAGFLRRFGSQLSEVTEGVNKVLSKTNGFITEVGSTVKGIDNIGKISSEIGNNFQEILRAPTAQKLRLVKKTVDQIKQLTGEVDKITGGVSKAVKKITGKTILSTSLFGNSTQNTLSDISNAVGIVTDRYNQFQTLTKTFSKAFEDISSDPVNFAVNELPKLFSQTEGFLKTIIGDTKAVADKLGIKLDNINLDPALVSTAKQFYGFAKGALGTFQSGQKLFTDFQNLFNSKDFKSGMANLQKLTASGKDFINNLDGLGQSLFKGKWAGIKGNFKNMVNKIGKSLGFNLQKAGEIFNKGIGVAGNVFGIYSDIKTLINMKELNAQTIMQSANAIMGITQKATQIMNTFGANIQTKALESVGNYIGTATAVFQIAKGIYDFVGWVNDVCDITYKTNIIQKELRYACLKTKIKVESMKIPIDKCFYDSVEVRRGYGTAKFCCNGTKCVYLQSKSCLQANDRCLKNRLSFIKSSSKFDKILAEAYEKFETSDLAMTAAQIDMKAAESLKERYGIAYNQTLALLRLNRLGQARVKKSQASVALAVSLLQKIVNKNSNTSRFIFEKAEFAVNLYSQNQERIPLTMTYKDQARLQHTLNFTMDFSNVQQTFEHTVKWFLSKITAYSIPRKRRSIDYDVNAVKNTPAPLKCKAYTDNMQLYVDIVEGLKSTVNKMFTGRLYSHLKRSRDIKTSKTPLEAGNQLFRELILLSTSTKKSIKDIISDWKKDSELRISQALEGKCSGFKDCVKAWKENIIQVFDAGLQNYKQTFKKISQLARILGRISSGRIFVVSVKANLRRSLKIVNGLNHLKSVCDNVPVFISKLPSSLIAYKGLGFELECPAEAKSAVEYQWFVNSTVLPGFNKKILSITNVESDDEGSYYCQVSNSAGTTQSDFVLVKIAEQLTFVEQLQDVAIPEANPEEITLVCNVTTSDDVSYNWWMQSLSGRVNKLHKNTALLDLGKVTRAKSGIYWCEASNGYDSIRSRKATIALVKSIRKYHSVQMEIDVKNDSEFVLCGSLSTENLDTINRAVKDVLMERFAFEKTKCKVSVDSYIDDKRENMKLIVVVSLMSKIGGAGSDEDLAADDAKIQVKMRKVVNEFWDEEKNIKFKFNECSYSLMESTAIVIWNAENLNCPAGMGLTRNNLRCLPCLPGNFDNGMSRCKQCPRGSYQSRFGQSNCIPCGNGLLTSLPGNLDASSCTKSEFKCYNELNIMLAIDTSSSVGQQGLSRTKKFLNTFINNFDVNTNSARFSLATFDDVAKLKGIFESATMLSQDISKIDKTGNSRRTDLLLDLANNVFDEDEDNSVRRVLLLISSGKRKLASDISIQNKVQALKSLGLDIFYIGVGDDISEKEAIIVSSSPKEEHFFKMADYSQLSNSANMVANSVCNSG